MLFISDVLVSPTGRGWQPVQISSWWWCICWNETLFPAPASDDLYKRLCIFPSFLFYLRSRQKKQHTFYNSSIFRLSACFYLNSLYLFFAGRSLNRTIPTAETCMSGRAYRHLASLLGCFSNLHLFCFGFRNANWAVLSTTVAQWVSKSPRSDLPHWQVEQQRCTKRCTNCCVLSTLKRAWAVKISRFIFTGLICQPIINFNKGKWENKYSGF